MFCKYCGFGSSCISGELMKPASRQSTTSSSYCLQELAHPILLPLSLGLAWHSALQDYLHWFWVFTAVLKGFSAREITWVSI